MFVTKSSSCKIIPRCTHIHIQDWQSAAYLFSMVILTVEYYLDISVPWMAGGRKYY